MANAAAGVCLNCGAPLAGRFCATCGQKASETDPTLGAFLRETTQEITDLDGKVPRTLRALFFDPGRLTLDLLAGRRARWLPPLRLYLLCSLAYFLSGPLVESITHRQSREIAKITITDDSSGSAALTPAVRAEMEKSRFTRLIGADRLERAALNGAKLNEIVTSAFPKAMFILLPLFAVLTNVAWRRTLPRYPAHLYLAVHLHAAWFGALALAELAGLVQSYTVDAVLGLGALTYVAWYALVALRRVFGDSWGKTIAKTAGVAVVYLCCFFGVSLGLLVYAVGKM